MVTHIIYVMDDPSSCFPCGVAPGSAELRRETEFKFLVTPTLIGGLNVGVTDHVTTKFEFF